METQKFSAGKQVIHQKEPNGNFKAEKYSHKIYPNKNHWAYLAAGQRQQRKESITDDRLTQIQTELERGKRHDPTN